ncbi:hypothetical protein BaRGS_00020744 [Batillaria attramentaria]|uniref:Uncharacterized protein n=1 Tax=Batillaria attramentaria TaxID=370345 RepID=A0ABD0KLL2_9CAEN
MIVWVRVALINKPAEFHVPRVCHSSHPHPGTWQQRFGFAGGRPGGKQKHHPPNGNSTDSDFINLASENQLKLGFGIDDCVILCVMKALCSHAVSMFVRYRPHEKEAGGREGDRGRSLTWHQTGLPLAGWQDQEFLGN